MHTMCHTVVVVKRNLRTSFTVVRTGWLQCGPYGIAWAARYGSQAAMDHSILFFFTLNCRLSTSSIRNGEFDRGGCRNSQAAHQRHARSMPTVNLASSLCSG